MMKRGEREPNELAAVCRTIGLKIAPIGLALRSAIEAEKNKQSTVGETAQATSNTSRGSCRLVAVQRWRSRFDRQSQ